MAENGNVFNPTDHLTNLGSESSPRMYLEVKWRLVWLRTEHPNATIYTKCEARTDSSALFSAVATLPDSGGSATGWGSETQDDFGDFIEKAETKAIGRALAALGYGTQFCDDFDEGGAVTDAPVQRKPTAPRRAARGTSAKPKASAASEAGETRSASAAGDDRVAAADDATAAEARRHYEETQGAPPPEPDAQPDQPPNPNCPDCGGMTSYKSGETNGKKWEGYFCDQRSHKVTWIKA